MLRNKYIDENIYPGCFFMFKRYMTFFVFLSILSGSVYALPDVAQCSAQAAVVIEGYSGAVLYGKNENKKLGMASTTKIMTAICAIEYGELEKVATVSSRAASVEGSSMYLEKGEKIKLKELVKGLMLVSGNDAATAIAENVSGSEAGFVLLMNQLASDIGVKKTSFQNPHGLATDGHYTTAQDLARITAYALKNPTFKEIVSTKSDIALSENGKKHFLTNHNKLLRLYDGCIGVKTGFTKATGRCLVTAAERDGMRLVCVTLNDGNDWQDHISMFDKAFSEYRAVKFLSAGQDAGKAYVTGGNKKKVDLKVKEDVYVPVKKGDNPKISLKKNEKIYLNAPVEKDVTTVNADIYLNNVKIGEAKLVANESSKEKAQKRKKNEKRSFLKRIFNL